MRYSIIKNEDEKLLKKRRLNWGKKMKKKRECKRGRKPRKGNISQSLTSGVFVLTHHNISFCPNMCYLTN